ncbi:MAG: hypothetical protein PHC96_05865 [Firmicutes bacterium]|nr:hypothetical protein [Bacillota bacterium]
MYYKRKKTTYLPFNLDLQVQVLFAAAALFGSFVVIVLALGLLSPESLGWSFVKNTTLWFISLWFIISIVLGLFRKTPLLLTSGLIALLLTVISGLVFFKRGLYVEDILVAFPILILWSLIYYFFERYRKGKNLRFVCLACSVLCLVGLVAWIAFLVYPVKANNVITVSMPESVAKEYKELTEKGSYSFSEFTINGDVAGSLKVDDLDLQEIDPMINPIKPLGKVYLPEGGDGRYPVVFINLNSFFYRDKDFAYLAEHLASKGYATIISPLYLEQRLVEINDIDWLRGLLIIKYLHNLANSFGNAQLDLGNVAFLSFGDAINATSSACYILQEKVYPPTGKFPITDDISVKTLLAIAPLDQSFESHLRNLNYIAVSGGQDPYANLDNDPIYNKVVYDSKETLLKSQIYLQDANHSYFLKNIPGMNFPGFLLFKRDSVLEAKNQKQVLKAVVTAAMLLSFDNTNLSTFFKNNDIEKLYPDLKTTMRTQIAGDVLITNFDSGYSLNSFIYENAKLKIESPKDWYIKDLGQNQALFVEATEETYLELVLPDSFSKDVGLNSKSSLAFSLANVKDLDLSDVYIEIETKKGGSHRCSLRDIKELPKASSSKPYKLEILNQYVKEPVFFETYAIPLYLFFSGNDYHPWQDLHRVKVTVVPELDKTATFLIDDICFREL